MGPCPILWTLVVAFALLPLCARGNRRFIPTLPGQLLSVNLIEEDEASIESVDNGIEPVDDFDMNPGVNVEGGIDVGVGGPSGINVGVNFGSRVHGNTDDDSSMLIPSSTMEDDFDTDPMGEFPNDAANVRSFDDGGDMDLRGGEILEEGNNSEFDDVQPREVDSMEVMRETIFEFSESPRRIQIRKPGIFQRNFEELQDAVRPVTDAFQPLIDTVNRQLSPEVISNHIDEASRDFEEFVAPAVNFGTKVTKPIVGVGAKVAAPFVKFGAKVAKPFVKFGAKVVKAGVVGAGIVTGIGAKKAAKILKPKLKLVKPIVVVAKKIASPIVKSAPILKSAPIFLAGNSPRPVDVEVEEMPSNDLDTLDESTVMQELALGANPINLSVENIEELDFRQSEDANTIDIAIENVEELDFRQESGDANLFQSIQDSLQPVIDAADDVVQATQPLVDAVTNTGESTLKDISNDVAGLISPGAKFVAPAVKVTSKKVAPIVKAKAKLTAPVVKIGAKIAKFKAKKLAKPLAKLAAVGGALKDTVVNSEFDAGFSHRSQFKKVAGGPIEIDFDFSTNTNAAIGPEPANPEGLDVRGLDLSEPLALAIDEFNNIIGLIDIQGKLVQLVDVQGTPLDFSKLSKTDKTRVAQSYQQMQQSYNGIQQQSYHDREQQSYQRGAPPSHMSRYSGEGGSYSDDSYSAGDSMDYLSEGSSYSGGSMYSHDFQERDEYEDPYDMSNFGYEQERSHYKRSLSHDEFGNMYSGPTGDVYSPTPELIFPHNPRPYHMVSSPYSVVETINSIEKPSRYSHSYSGRRQRQSGPGVAETAGVKDAMYKGKKNLMQPDDATTATPLTTTEVNNARSSTTAASTTTTLATTTTAASTTIDEDDSGSRNGDMPEASPESTPDIVMVAPKCEAELRSMTTSLCHRVEEYAITMCDNSVSCDDMEVDIVSLTDVCKKPSKEQMCQMSVKSVHQDQEFGPCKVYSFKFTRLLDFSAFCRHQLKCVVDSHFCPKTSSY